MLVSVTFSQKTAAKKPMLLKSTITSVGSSTAYVYGDKYTVQQSIGQSGIIGKVKTKNMEHLVKINTIATFNVAQLCTLKMIKSKNRKKIGGAIVNMSSQMGHVGGPIRSVYNMNKWGLEGLTKGMALDLAKYNIRVNTVCPTFVVTPMTKKFLKNKKFKKETLANIPLGRFAEMSEIASSVVFLASDAASMITGTSLLVDGGWTAK